MNSKQKFKQFITGLLLVVHSLMWIFILPLTELQMSLFGRRIITALGLGIIEIFLMVVLLFLDNYKIKNGFGKTAFYTALAFLLLLVVSLVINPGVAIYWRNYYILYWVLPFLVLAMCVQQKVHIKPIINVLLFCIVVNAVLIIIQHYTNDLIWTYTLDDEGNRLFYNGIGYYNSGRFMDKCPGLCVSGLEAGVLLIFGIILTIIATYISIPVKVGMILLFLVATWFTGTRNVYVQLIFIIFVSLLQNLKINKKSKLILYIASTFAASILYLILFNNITGGVSTKNITTDTLSVSIRLSIWKDIIADINKAGILRFIFGQGVWQSAGYKYVIDNMYLELIIAAGVIGLSVYSYFLICGSKYLIGNGIIGSLLAAFILSAFVYGMANVVGNSFMGLIIFAIVIFHNRDQIALKNRISS